MRAGDKAWLALAAGVAAWDLLSPPGEMLSEASARYAAARPIVSRAIIVYIAGHLMHVWPRWADAFNLAARTVGR